MSPSESEDDIKKIDHRPDPLCLFCYPFDDENEPLCTCCCGVGDGGLEGEKTYVGREDEQGDCSEAAVRRTRRRWPAVKEKQEMWLRRRREATTKRRRKKVSDAVSGRSLKSYLFMSAPTTTTESDSDYVPCLVGALETVKDAWGPHRRLVRPSYLEEKHIFGGKGCGLARIDEERDESTPPSPPPPPFHLLSRRSSMPEEVMRRYSLKKSNVSSEDSEDNQTVPNPPSVSSKDSYLEDHDGDEATDPYASAVPTTDEPRPDAPPHRLKRVTQTEYDSRGRGIIRVRTRERSSQTGRSGSSPPETTAGDNTATTDSLPSSSPVQLPGPEASTSGNLSSSSEDVRCTCQDMLSSKDTSTDPFRSGNSTLSQTVSEKSASTQDSTVSIRSVSTGGDSTPSITSNYSSPDDPVPGTSAKETTPSERTTPQRRVLGKRPPKFRRRSRAGKRFRRKKREFRVPCHCAELDACNAEDILELSHREVVEEEEEAEERARQRVEENEIRESASDRLKYSPEEIHMMQQMRYGKLLERTVTDLGSMSACATSGSVYKRPEDVRDRILVPRYSALPRTLSMIVNTSGGDTSALNSDSDSLSLADSLEDFPVTHVHRVSYDTANERKPVRGDVNAVESAHVKVNRKKGTRSRAFFVSMKDPSGEDDLLSGIDRIPEPPEKIKERIDGRQFRLRKMRLEKRKRAKERRLQKIAVTGETSSGTREEDNGKKDCRRSSRMPSPACDMSENRRQRGKERDEGMTKSGVKPQAVIHPSQPVELDRKRQPVLATQLRAAKYRQRFEAIPEEKSSSLSSTDERKLLARRSSKTVDSPSTTKSASQRKCSIPSLVFAKLVSKSLPESSDPVRRPVILVSPKSVVSNSRKGRDTLIAMNREDFTRLSKGWMNFYVMKDMDEETAAAATTTTETETSGKREEERKCSGKAHCGEAKTTTFTVKGRGDGADDGSGNIKNGVDEEDKERKQGLADTVKLHSSNTVLRPIKGTPRAQAKKSLSLPELNLPTSGATSGGESRPSRGKLVLPRVRHKSHDCDGMDSDSTVYCQPPSFIVPRLAFDGSGDFPSEGSDSDDTDTVPKAKPPTLPMKHLPLRKRGTAPKLRPKREGHHHDTPKRSQPGWSVTVAGTLELSSAAPDLEMRLSFPAAPGAGVPQASHSDSGFADEGSHYVETSARDTGNLTSGGTGKQRWTVTVKNPIPGSGDAVKRRQNKIHVLPDLGRSRDTRNVKEVLQSLSVRSSASECHRKISIYWPKMGTPKDDWVDDVTNDKLSVRGSAVVMEPKPKPLSMSDRDVTRGLSARTGHSDKCFK